MEIRSDRKPLIIKGSRQVGKTESIKHFAEKNYESVIEINFVRDEKYKGIISDGYEAADIIKIFHLLIRQKNLFLKRH
ncbi:MAG: AAA family ATPase [Clostridium sp.]